MAMDPDGSIRNAAADLERSAAELAAANSALAEAATLNDRVTGQIAVLTERRTVIINRRAGGMQKPGDAAELALIQADVEGLGSIASEAAAGLAEARKASVAAAAARARAADALSEAEDAALSGGLHERLEALATILADTLRRDDVLLKRRRLKPGWVAPHPSLTALQKRAAERPDLSQAGLSEAGIQRCAPPECRCRSVSVVICRSLVRWAFRGGAADCPGSPQEGPAPAAERLSRAAKRGGGRSLWTHLGNPGWHPAGGQPLQCMPPGKNCPQIQSSGATRAPVRPEAF